MSVTVVPTRTYTRGSGGTRAGEDLPELTTTQTRQLGVVDVLRGSEGQPRKLVLLPRLVPKEVARASTASSSASIPKSGHSVLSG